MPREAVSMEIEASCERVFDLVHDYGKRLEWDAMLSEAKILGGFEAAGKDVRTRCVGTWRSAWTAMETDYVNFQRGRVAAVRLTNRPVFFSKFAATIRHEAISNSRSRLTYIYSFRAKPSFLAFAMEPVMNVLLRRETARRLVALRDYIAARKDDSQAI